MARQGNRMMIGGFVVLAVIILMASLVVFGSGKFFKKTETFVLFFDGSVKGLNAGSPVLFQGVQIGSVTSVVIRRYANEEKVKIPVTIEIEPQKIEMGDNLSIRKSAKEGLQNLIDLGLRAVLTTQSYITGQLMIECDFYPGSPVVYRDVEKKHLEIPTIRSTKERLVQTLQDLDVEGIQQTLESILTGIDQLVNNKDLPESIRIFKQTADRVQLLVQKIDTTMSPLAADLGSTLQDSRKLVNSLNNHVDPLSKDIHTAVSHYSALAKTAETQLTTLTSDLDAALAAGQDVISADAPFMVEFKTTMKEISNAARAFQQLVDYLEQHPETIIKGKQDTEKK